MIASNFSSKSDFIGSIASGLCVLHCLATPFLFLAQSCSTTACCATGPLWWSAIDYIFIAITFFAIYWSAKNSSKTWIKYGLYISWLALSLIIINEKVSWFPLSELWKYGSALVLISLHIYNFKYCRCAGDTCCAK